MANIKGDKKYTVWYQLDGIYSPTLEIEVEAPNAETAYDIAYWYAIPERHGKGTQAWAAWVATVTYSTGRVHRFNTYAGKRY